MKTGEVRSIQHADGRVDQYLEVDGWSPWLYYLTEDESVASYYEAANACTMRLERTPHRARERMARLEIRCPINGCLLATVYELPGRLPSEDLANGTRREGTYLYVGRSSSGKEVYDILNYPAPVTHVDEARGDCGCHRILYWRAGCRHGTATLDRERLYDMMFVAMRVIGPYRTEEQALARLPEHLRGRWGKRVFHPAPQAWHPKKRSNKRATLRS